MKPFVVLPRLLICLVTVLPQIVFAQDPLPETPAESSPEPGTAAPFASGSTGSGEVVFIVPVKGDVNPVLDMVINRAIREARREDVTALIFDMDTFGGALDSAVRVRDRLVVLDVPTYTYVNNKAISAGSLIALSTDTIVMANGSNIGAALPVQVGAEGMTAADEKMISVMASEMRKTAKAKGHPPDLAEAFCNPDFELPGIKEKDDILTLDYDEAVELGLAAYTANTMEDLLAAEGFLNARIVRFQETPTDRVARFLVSPVVMGMLMTLGVGGLFIELRTPGVGLPGAVGLAALGIYFFGSYLAQLSGYMEVIVFVLGVVLVAVEIFVIPGFGVAGISGILLMVGALFFALFNMAPEGFDFNFRRIEAPLWTMTMSMLSIAPVVWLAGWILPKTPFYSQLTLAPPAPSNPAGAPSNGVAGVGSGNGGGIAPAAEIQPPKPGDRGRTLTQLRPSGKVLIGGQRLDVISEGDFVDLDCEVQIVSIRGSTIAVRVVQ